MIITTTLSLLLWRNIIQIHQISNLVPLNVIIFSDKRGTRGSVRSASRAPGRGEWRPGRPRQGDGSGDGGEAERDRQDCLLQYNQQVGELRLRIVN